MYGPTEAAVDVSYHACARDSRSAIVPIGRPVANTQLYILDAQQPVPVGVAGELHIGGVQLARGYLNRPELTAEKFITSSVVSGQWSVVSDSSGQRTTDNGQRLYRTGDLARWLGNGEVEYLGRLDHQVKIRGFRIELGEIEAVLGEHGGVREAVVVAREEQGGDKRLVAYLIAEEGRQPNVSELREYLGQRLPEYMVPSAFVMLEAFPLSPNGKVDRKALPAPDTARPDLEAQYVAPRTPIEKLIAQTWSDILGVEKIGIHDNFFELGGDSLKAAVFVNRLQEEAGINCHLRVLFFVPHIAGLAAYCYEYYPDLVEKLGAAQPGTDEEFEFRKKIAAPDQVKRIDESHVAEIRRIITPLAPHESTRRKPKNPRAIFLLSPPRSGSTLLRVMLEGHPQLFSPPELELLSFNTLAERRHSFARDYQMVLEGTIRALMEINQCDADTATRMMEEYERQNMSTRDFYQLIQDSIGERTLVDKTPVYAFDPAMLERAEEIFDEPLYIHLVRHPYATIYSFIEARLDEYFFRYPHQFAPRELSELIWIISHQNILDFFERIPAERQHRVYYEEIVTDSRHAIEGLCNFMHISFHPDMLEPYKGRRMTDGIRPTSQMIGDLKFYLRREIDAKASERWRKHHKEEFLSEVGWQLAERLGYEREPAQPRQVTISAPAPLPEAPLKRASRDGELPLSFGQQRLWFLDQLEPGSPLYNIPSAVRFTGNLKIAVLERALTEIVRRHEILRTTFETVNGEPSLRIAEAGDVTLPVTDLRLYPAEERERQVELMAAEEARRPFDLARGPLLRARLLQVSDDEHIALFTMHHIVSDGWSSQVMVRELGLLYEAYLSNQASPLDELPIQYADYAAWQRELMQGERLQSQLDFWQRTLQGAPHPDLPTDRPRPAVLTNRGARLPFIISTELFAKLETLSRREGVTLFMTLLAAFQTLLARYSNQDDISIGSPIANRNHAETEGLIGFFVNTLVLRGDLSGNPTFRELLHRTRDTAVQAYAHQELPFEMLVDALQPERSLNRPPLFQVMMTLNKAALPQLKLPGLTISPILVDSRTAKFDLTLSLVERSDGVRGALEYNTDLFDEATIARMTGHFERLLESAVSNPDEHIGQLRLLSERERTQLLNEWSGPRLAFPAAPAIHERVAAQAERTPDAIALTFEDQQLTYRELNDRAAQLAHYLRRRGVTTGTLVGLCMERSLEMVVGLLGILKAGAAYLPLDLAYPPERLAFMLEDAQAPLLLTQAHLKSQISNFKSEIELVCLDADWPLIAQESTVSPDLTVQPDDLAYVIYTSGSTGKPKGCQVTHGNVVRLLTATEDWFHFDERDVWTFFHSHAFDFSVWEIWGALCYGGRLVVVPYLTSRSPEAFYQLLGRERVTVLNQTPSAFRQLMRAEEEAGVHPDLSLRLVIFGGEALELQTLRPWFARHGDERPQLVNMYGITETTVHVTYRPIRLADVESGAGSVIGCPIPDLQIYVLDQHREPVPVGVPGELYVGGAGVSRGYLNRPELTAERFISWKPEVGSRKPEAGRQMTESSETALPFPADYRLPTTDYRLYKTGDLARWLANGDLEYLGRIDQQVKIRGFRIELGEIEAVLTAHPAIGEVTVLVREDEPGVKRLAAYLVAQDEAQPSQSELRDYLKVKLPEYMVPSAFVWVEAIPLTANGKVDRRALPVPESERPELESAYVAAQSEAEQALVEIWQQVLGLKQVGVNDNFFELGGDSILSIQVIARARAAGLHLTPKQLFEHPTISALAAVAGAASMIEAEQGVVEGEAPLTPIQHWFFEQQQPEPWHWNQAVMLEVSQPLTQPLLVATLNQLLSHHDALRLRYEQTAAGWHQINAASSDEAPLQWFDLSAMNEAAQRAAIESTAQQLQAGLNLTAGPLLRAAYFDCGSRPARLLLVIHHLVIDGVSWRVLLEDFQTAYAQLSQAQPVQLPLKTTSYKHWSARLAEYAQGDEPQQQLAYWLSVTGGRVGLLPVDFTNGENTESSARSVQIELSEDETKSLLHEVPQAYGTEISDVLLAALGQALTRWSGAGAALVDLEGHGREDILERVDVSRTVGWFTTIYPVRLEVRQEWSEGETVKQIKEQLRRIPQRGIGYGLLRYLSRDESVRQQLQAQLQAEVVFNYLGQFDQNLREGALFSPARESVGHSHSQRGRRHHLLEINGGISGGRLRMEFSYSTAIHQQATIERVAGDFIASLRALIAHCLAPEAVGYTPSDFADADLSQAELDALISGLSQV
ncbi:MAG: amino acid adenylation domain-containing protein [Blastocatellia bacterium]